MVLVKRHPYDRHISLLDRSHFRCRTYPDVPGFAFHFVSYLDMNGTVLEADGMGYFNCHLTVVRKMKSISREVIDDKRFWD